MLQLTYCFFTKGSTEKSFFYYYLLIQSITAFEVFDFVERCQQASTPTKLSLFRG